VDLASCTGWWQDCRTESRMIKKTKFCKALENIAL
jgi:hypothetical protein